MDYTNGSQNQTQHWWYKSGRHETGKHSDKRRDVPNTHNRRNNIQNERDNVFFKTLGYHQIKLGNKSREITTFSTLFCLRGHKRLSLGITSASGHFQKNNLRGNFYNLKGVHKISKGTVIWGKDTQWYDWNLTERETWLKEGVQKIGKKSLALNKEKCQFSIDKTSFFGMSVWKDGVSADEREIEAVKICKPSKTFLNLKAS